MLPIKITATEDFWTLAQDRPLIPFGIAVLLSGVSSTRIRQLYGKRFTPVLVFGARYVFLDELKTWCALHPHPTENAAPRNYPTVYDGVRLTTVTPTNGNENNTNLIHNMRKSLAIIGVLSGLALNAMAQTVTNTAAGIPKTVADNFDLGATTGLSILGFLLVLGAVIAGIRLYKRPGR